MEDKNSKLRVEACGLRMENHLRIPSCHTSIFLSLVILRIGDDSTLYFEKYWIFAWYDWMSICSRFLEFCLKSSCQVWRQGVIGLLFGVSHVTSCCQIFKIITEHTSQTFLAKPSKKTNNRVNKIRMNNLNTYFLAVTATQEAHLSVCVHLCKRPCMRNLV